VTAVTRTCARPGCREAAVATLAYAYGDRTVWLEDLAAEAHPMTHDLCATHAHDLRVPQGWTCRDLRDAERGRATSGQLFADAIPA
jgi:hypothetical protein